MRAHRGIIINKMTRQLQFLIKPLPGESAHQFKARLKALVKMKQENKKVITQYNADSN